MGKFQCTDNANNRMNITDQLESIIYKISDGFPAFSDYLAAKRLISKYFAGIPQDSCVLLVGSCETDIDYAYWLSGESLECQTAIVDFINGEKSPTINNFQKFNKIVIVSYFGKRELSHGLALRGVEAECLYDYLTLNGVVLQHNWYDCILTTYWATLSASNDFKDYTAYYDLYYERKMYYGAKGSDLKAYRLRRMIFICLHMRDFIYAKRYVDEYAANGFTDAKQVTDAWSEVEILLAKIKAKLSHKTERDTIMFWLDALEYGQEKHMPFLNGLDDNTITFENAFTVTPVTQPTLKAMISAKKVIDDKSYNIRNISKNDSSFVKVLEQNGVDFISCSFQSHYLDKTYRSRAPIFTLMATGNVFWQAIEELLAHEKPLCVLAHEVSNSHIPYLSSNNDSDDGLMHSSNWLSRTHSIITTIEKPQHIESLHYLDEQLAFYTSLLPKAMTKIYFSDHGTTPLGRYHTVIKIHGGKRQHAKVQGIFSYIDWHKLVRFLYEPDKQPLETLTCEHAEIQDVDYYDAWIVTTILASPNNRDFLSFLSYRGIVTNDEIFIRCKDGYEKFWNRQSGKEPISPQRLEELRQLCGDNYIDPFSDPKFKYSRYTHMAIGNYLKRTGNYEKEKTETIRRLFSTDKTVAIRTGGDAALQLLLCLYPDLNSNVKFIIDNNPDCTATYFGGVTVMNVEQAQKANIAVVVMPSYDLREQLKIEQYGNAEVIDLYDYLAEAGFPCHRNFWEYDITKEDINFDIED